MFAEMGAFNDKLVKAGIMKDGDGLKPSRFGKRVTFKAGGKRSVTDGPFAETKELIDGFALIRANSLPEAIEHAQRFMDIAGEGDSEILQVFDSDEIPGK